MAVICPRLLLLGLLTLTPVASFAQCPGVTSQQMPFANEIVTVSSTAKPLNGAIYKPSGVTPTMGLLTIEGGDVRYQVVGNPTATTGHPLLGTPATTIVICGLESLAAFRAIRQAGTDATITATYYKNKTP